MNITATPRPPGLESRPYDCIAVIGAGSWGTALAAVAATAGRKVRLYSRDEKVAQSINTAHLNAKYLPDVPLPENLTAVTDMAAALSGAEAVMMVVPSRAVRAVAAFIMRQVIKIDQALLAARGAQDHISAVAAVTAVGAAPGDVLLTAERGTASTAVAGEHLESGLVDEGGHGF